MITRRVLLLALFVLALAAPASADSDGYYCGGPDYIAYQFGMSGPPTPPHRLHIVRFDPKDGLRDAMTISLPQFQVHGMQCTAEAVLVASFDSLYTIRFDAQGKPVALETAPLPGEGKIPPALQSHGNLGAGSRPVGLLKTERTVLAKTPSGRSFVLEIVPRKSTTRCITSITTRLVDVDANGQPIRSRVIFSGSGHRECGE